MVVRVVVLLNILKLVVLVATSGSIELLNSCSNLLLSNFSTDGRFAE